MEFDAAIPIYLQVIEDIKKRIVTEELQLGAQLPSVRELALQYQVNPNTASRIYREIDQQGLCYTKRGTGTFITEDVSVKENIKHEMAMHYVTRFLNDMQGLGYDQQGMIEIINQMSSKEDNRDAGK